MHGVGVAAIERRGNPLGDDRRIEIVPRAFPDAGVVGQRSHAVAIAGMIATDLAEWIWTGGLLRFRSHSRCGHPYVGSAGATKKRRNHEPIPNHGSMPKTRLTTRRSGTAYHARPADRRRSVDMDLKSGGQAGVDKNFTVRTSTRRDRTKQIQMSTASRGSTGAGSSYRRDVLGLDLRRGCAAFAELEPLAFLFARFVIMVALAFAVLLVLQRGLVAGWSDPTGVFALAGPATRCTSSGSSGRAAPPSPRHC